MHGSDRQAYEPSMTWTCKLITAAVCSVPRTHTHAHQSSVFDTSMAMALSHEWEHGGTDRQSISAHKNSYFPLSDYGTEYSWALLCDKQQSIIYLLMDSFDKQLKSFFLPCLNLSFVFRSLSHFHIMAIRSNFSHHWISHSLWTCWSAHPTTTVPRLGTERRNG